MPEVDTETLAISLNVRCSIELYQRAATIAADNDTTVSDVVRLALDVGLQELDGATIQRAPVVDDAPTAHTGGAAVPGTRSRGHARTRGAAVA